MPTSSWRNIPAILGIILALHPRPSRVLDVGIGYGKFGFLCKEYLTYWNLSEPYGVMVDGIEAFPEYVGQLQRHIYDQIFIGDAQELLPRLPADSYDLVLLIDVLEHFDKDEGAKIIAECRRVGRAVIVSTPRRFWPQMDAWDNPYERHRSLWTKKDLVRLGAVHIRHAENWIAVFAKPPYDEGFTWVYRARQWGYRWIPAWLRPRIRWFWRIALWFSKPNVH